MKLIVQIPCYNEEGTLARTVADIPRRIEGIDQVEILVVDDGSTDRTMEVARELKVDHIARHKSRRGLARAFRTGIDACLKAGADIIVNTDGDNQYPGSEIPKLCAPVISGRADIVIGERTAQMSNSTDGTKRAVHWVGNTIVRKLSETTVTDAVSGFRALSRDAALQLNIVSPFSYTIEMVIQAGKKGMQVTFVPVVANEATRGSRLFRSIPQFVERQARTIVRVYSMYQPLRVFVTLAAVLTLIGLIPIVRFLYFYFSGSGAGHVQSLVLGGAFLTMGFVTLLVGLVADLISFNRQLIEMALERIRRLELDGLESRSRSTSSRADRPR